MDDATFARQRIAIVVGAVGFVALLVAGMVAESDALLTAVGIYAIVAGILLGRLLVSWEPEPARPAPEQPADRDDA